MLNPKEWLDENEWDNVPIESTTFSHYITLDTLMEEYAKVLYERKIKRY